MKVSAVNNYQINSNRVQNRQEKVSFKGIVNGVEYPDELIKEAEKLLAENKEVNIEDYQMDFLTCWEDAKFQPVAWLLAPYAKLLGSQDPVRETRKSLGIATLGLSELAKLPEASIRKLLSNKRAKEHVTQRKNCMLDLLKDQSRKVIK